MHLTSRSLPSLTLPLFTAIALQICAGCALIRTPLDIGSRRPYERAVPQDAPHHFEHVVIIVLENQDYETAMQDCYLKTLASQGVVFTNFKGLFHNSYPNYLAMVGGREFPVDEGDSDRQIDIRRGVHGETQTIADRIPAWKNYAEDYPTGPDAHEVIGSGLYARKHVPFASFEGTCTSNNLVSVPGDIDAIDHRFFLDADGDPKSFPEYVFYSPNMRNDGHNWSRLDLASAWLAKFVPRFQKTRVAPQTLVVITFDESACRGKSNHIYTLFLGPMLNPHRHEYDAPANHYNVLRTIEDNFGVQPLADGDGGANTIEDIWDK